MNSSTWGLDNINSSHGMNSSTCGPKNEFVHLWTWSSLWDELIHLWI